jgi:hypothetical protein
MMLSEYAGFLNIEQYLFIFRLKNSYHRKIKKGPKNALTGIVHVEEIMIAI